MAAMPACCSTSRAAPISSARTRRANAPRLPLAPRARPAPTTPAPPPRHDRACPPALADTAGAAWALARFAERQADLFCPARGHRGALAALPVEGLRLEAPVIETFLKLGLRRIGDLYPLPRAPPPPRLRDQLPTPPHPAPGTLADPTDP